MYPDSEDVVTIYEAIGIVLMGKNHKAVGPV